MGTPGEIAALRAVGPYLRTPEGEHYTSQSAREFSVLNLEAMLADGQDPPLDLDAYTAMVVDTFIRAVTAEEPT